MEFIRKMKRYIYTETGEVRLPKKGECFINSVQMPEVALFDFEIHKQKICDLIIEDMPIQKEQGSKYFVKYHTNGNSEYPIIIELPFSKVNSSSIKNKISSLTTIDASLITITDITKL